MNKHPYNVGHKSNWLFWDYCRSNYPEHFAGDIRVIEFGSAYINGTIRDHFGPVTEYIGVDWREAECVDLVSLAHEVDLPVQFDTVVSGSLLEHDPYWEKSLANMVRLLTNSGALFLSWGAARNTPHCLAEAPDGKFHSLKADLVIKKLNALEIYIHEFHYEGSLFPNASHRGNSDGMGEVCLIGFKEKTRARGELSLCPLLPEDRE